MGIKEKRRGLPGYDPCVNVLGRQANLKELLESKELAT
jgi:hypothetical protein